MAITTRVYPIKKVFLRNPNQHYPIDSSGPLPSLFSTTYTIEQCTGRSSSSISSISSDLTHITDLSRECICRIFSYLPLTSLRQAGQVCSSWRTEQLHLCNQRQSLVLYDERYQHRRVFHYDDQLYNFYESHDMPETPTGKLSILRVNTRMQYSPLGPSLFVNLTSLDVQWNRSETVQATLAPLLFFFSSQLTHLALYLTYSPHPSSTVASLDSDLLFQVINNMTALQTLDLRLACIQHFDLSILTRLRRFIFYTSDYQEANVPTLERLVSQWSEYIQMRDSVHSGPLEVHLLTENFTSMPFEQGLSYLPLTQCITRLGSFTCPRLEQLSTQFSSLTHLRINFKTPNGYPFLIYLFGRLAALPLLTNLQMRITLREEVKTPTNEIQTIQQQQQWRQVKQLQLAQLALPQVHTLALHLIGLATGLYHTDLANLVERCPSVQQLTTQLMGGCNDCRYPEWFAKDLAADNSGLKAAHIGRCLEEQLQALMLSGRLPALQCASVGAQGVSRRLMVKND